MNNTTLSNTNLRAFQLKGSLLTLTILELLTTKLSDVDSQLLTLTKQTPDLFRRMPIIVDLNKIKNISISNNIINFSELKRLLEKSGLVPIGIRGADSQQEKIAIAAGFAVLNNTRPEKYQTQASQDPKNHISQTLTDTQTDTQADTQTVHSKMITTPVRSGQQIYAKEGDLIILGSVSPGAEIVADGNIHVYGALHGRALAGVNGNKNARIFCHKLKAELVSISGVYWVNEDLSLPLEEYKTIQIYLDPLNDKLQLNAI